MAGPQNFVEVVVQATALSTGEIQTKPIWNVFHFQRIVPGTAAPVKSDINVAFTGGVFGAMLAALSVSYISNNIAIRFIDDVLDPYQNFSTAAAVGAIAGDSLPSLNAVTIQLQSGVRGRSFRGSKHFGPCAESDTLLDHLVAGAVGRYGSIGSTLLTGFTDGSGGVWKPVIISRKLSQLVTNPTTIVSVPVSSTSLDTILGQMKRRKQRS